MDYSRLQELAKHNVIVMGAVASGRDVIDCVEMLCEAMAMQTKRLVQLERLAPRKIKSGDKYLIWRCPENLIPESVIGDTWPLPLEPTEGVKGEIE